MTSTMRCHWRRHFRWTYFLSAKISGFCSYSLTNIPTTKGNSLMAMFSGHLETFEYFRPSKWHQERLQKCLADFTRGLTKSPLTMQDAKEMIEAALQEVWGWEQSLTDSIRYFADNTSKQPQPPEAVILVHRSAEPILGVLTHFDTNGNVVNTPPAGFFWKKMPKRGLFLGLARKRPLVGLFSKKAKKKKNGRI